MKCTCEEWNRNIREIDKYFIYIGLYRNDIGYTGLPFQYCPWCGCKLIDDYDDGARVQEDIRPDGG